ncbi:TRAP transporter large permease [Sediminicoccus rosea]|uniref:TRAP transporter large permease protein n=1 Tax=Sediminicoccus rosea TaxID=1225128 RepID=A0ABZ0PCJ0_9PROT|nr:TRAP transporter large permease [Sediminicoccus rosea]WPB83414.1 TRAP transporter large permease [Sediminicoccus rosea]
MITGIAFAVLLFIGAPIGIVLGLSAAAYIFASNNQVLLGSYPIQMFGGVENYGLLAIPLFLILGEIMNGAGITTRLIGLARAFVGTVRGGLAYINVLANALMASILGSAAAQIAIMSRVIVPEMDREGYDRRFSVATTASAGLLAPIIPPSMMFVVYAVLARVATGDMFLAGIIPGLMMTAGFFLVIFCVGLVSPFPAPRPLGWGDRLRLLRDGALTLLIPVVIIGSITTGVATATESAAVACVAAYLIGRFVTREFHDRDLPRMLLAAGRNAAVVLFMVATAAVFGWVLTFGKVPQDIAAWIQTIATGPVSFMLLVNFILLVIGTVIDGIPGLIMVVPILLPIATDIYGIDPVHFGVVVSINLVLGLVSPPVGIALFIAAAVTKMKPGQIFLWTIPYCVTTAVVLVLLSIFPALTLYLVR